MTEVSPVRTHATQIPETDLLHKLWINRLLPMLTRRIGGPMGQHKRGWSPAWAYLLATLSWAICMLRQIPCHETLSGQGPDRFKWMCYTDITALYFSRGQATGGLPYIDVAWEYPVLTGYLATISQWISSLSGASFAEDINSQQQVLNADIYFSVTSVLLFICLLWLVSSTLLIAPKQPGIAMLMAISPALMTTGLINWDLLVISLTAAGLASWLDKKPIWAGFWWGLAVAAKLYPIVIIGALFVLCLRKGAVKTPVVHAWLLMACSSVATWLIVNLPLMTTHPGGWSYFYTFNYQDRGADLGSLWFALDLAGLGVDNPALWSRLIMILGYLGLAALIFFARKAPSAQQIAYLAVAIFVLGNLVYSPQYVLWVLPLIVLVRPHWRDLWVFTVSELFYFCFIWLYLRRNDLTLGISDVPWVYIFSILLRITATIWVMNHVVRDVLTAKEELTS
ncbi:MAG: glycosyltransferase 87 family protein [Propionibacteriaceae bacterium]|jgi:uncharacterized membrane protein|nr:glycosyltransferase 87 family protein [Propionibacteriaceae bacterium]